MALENEPERWAREMLARLVGGALRGRFDVLSVDVFDTLLRRRIPSSEVSAAQAARVARLLHGGSPASILRVQAHRWAWEQDLAARARRAPLEGAIRQWAESLADDTGAARDHAVEVAEASWLWCEARANRLDVGLWDTLRRVRDVLDVKLVAVSDGWASHDLLARLLAQYGVEVDAVFGSAEAGASKRHGGLYPLVAASLGTMPERMVHVGDNLEADVVRAWRAHVPAVWVPHRESVGRRRVHTGKERAFTLSRLLVEPAAQSVDTPEAFAATVLAPLLTVWDFATRRNAARHASDARVFVARDAFHAHRWADRVDGLLGAGPPSHYVRLSRRVVALSHPARLLESVPGWAGRAGTRTVGDVLGAFELPDALRASMLHDHGLRTSARLTADSAGRLATATWQARAALEALRAERTALIRDYLRQEVGAAGRWMMVDIGWSGTTQDVVATALPSLERVDATYLGLGLTYPIGDRVSRWGLLRDEGSGAAVDARWTERLAASLRVWEVALREPSPTVRALVRSDDGTVLPELAERGPTDAELSLARRIDAGLDEGWASLTPQIELAAELLPLLTDADLRDAARQLTAPFAWRPGRALATALLAAGYDEASGRRRDLGNVWQDPRDVWWAGVLGRLLG